MSNRVHVLSGIGAHMPGIEKEKMKDISVLVESGSVHVWVKIQERDDVVVEALQYLTAEEAMSFAKAFERCAIQALKDRA